MRFILLLLLTLNLLNAQKIALLIGNNDYSFQPLDNPLNDVDGIYKTLREIGFKSSNITVLKNKSQNEMKKALFEFEQKASKAEIALIYFSGHGMQVNNTNYMFPANTTATKPIHLEGLVNLNFFIQSASSAKYGIILVDACRNNPLVKYFEDGKHKGSSAKKGLGQVTPTAGQVVIGFATSAGDTADDGSGSMSPYAFALANRLKEPNKDITKVLGLVALDVSAKYEQNPVIRTNLAYDVCLSGSLEKKNTNAIYSNNSERIRQSESFSENRRFNQILLAVLPWVLVSIILIFLRKTGVNAILILIPALISAIITYFVPISWNQWLLWVYYILSGMFLLFNIIVSRMSIR